MLEQSATTTRGEPLDFLRDHVAKCWLPDDEAARSALDFANRSDPVRLLSGLLLYDHECSSSESWGITQVNAPGVYGVFEGRTQAVNVGIFADSSGVPGDVIPGCGYIGITDFDDTGGPLTIRLRSTCILPAAVTTKKYWLTVQAEMGDAASGGSGFGVWYWKENSTQTGDLAQWENPQNGFNENCPTWGPRATCNLDAMPDQCFLIAGAKDVIFQDGFGEP